MTMYVIVHVKEDVCLSVPKSLYTENGLWSKVTYFAQYVFEAEIAKSVLVHYIVLR